MKTKDIVEALCKKHDTRNPFEIARQKKIMVIHEPLGSINGYYNRCYRQSFIHINSDLEREQQLFTCAHELGHAVLHPKANAPFLRANTFFSINKLEIEANKFAVNLLVQDEAIIELSEFSVPEIACILGSGEDLVLYKYQLLKDSKLLTAR